VASLPAIGPARGAPPRPLPAGGDGATVVGAGSLPRAKISDDDVESQQLLVPSRAPAGSPDKAVGGLVEPNGHFSSVSGRHAAAKLAAAADGAGLASPGAERQQQQPCVGGGALETDGSESSDPGPPGGGVPRSASSRSGGSSNRHVTFITAVLMGVALCFHSLLEVRRPAPRRPARCDAAGGFSAPPLGSCACLPPPLPLEAERCALCTQGAAMGAQQTISNSLHIFIAIVSHKGLAAYALGSSIVDSGAE
jgi:zinc transporter 1/2/3